MGDRHAPRAHTRLVVTVSGIDSSGNPFRQTAYARDVSQRGARLDGIECLRGPGETIEVEHSGKKANCFVVWVGNPGTPEYGHIGIKILERDKTIWKLELPKPQADGFTRRVAEVSNQPQPAPSASLRQQRDRQRSQGTDDRRQYRRYAIKGSAEFRMKGSDARMSCTLSDISPGGCYLEMSDPCVAGTQLEMTLELSGVRVLAEGVVKVTYPTLGMGITLTKIAEEQRERLKQLVAPWEP